MARTVLVLFGGVSTEHMVSCRSAVNIIRGLRQAGFRVVRVGITMQGEWLRFLPADELITEPDWAERARAALSEAGVHYGEAASVRAFIEQAAGETFDVIFPAVHGINCEDGALQGLLQLAGFPYVGAGILSSAVCMDKAASKVFLRDAGLPVVPDRVVYRREVEADADGLADRLAAELGLPLFLKPANGGSSVGTQAVEERGSLPRALRETAEFDNRILVEQQVDAREIEVAVLGNDEPVAAAPGEIVMSAGTAYYDYETKYFSDTDSEARIPADLPGETAETFRQLALRAYTALGVSGLARVDFFLTRADGTIYINEINNLPGFTAISLYPKAFQAAGMNLPELVTKLLDYAVERHERQLRRESV